MKSRPLKNKKSFICKTSVIAAISIFLIFLSYQTHPFFQKLMIHPSQCWSKTSENLQKVMQKDYHFTGAYYNNDVNCYAAFSQLFTKEQYEIASQTVQTYVNANGLCNLEAPKSLIEIKKIEKENNSKLIGQWGAFARQNLTKMQCVGEYTGNLYLDNEFYKLIENIDNPKIINKKYDYNMEVYFKDSIFNTYDSKLPNAYTIDGYFENYESMSPIAFINDARMDISQLQRTENDQKTQNTAFVYCNVNGFPFPFVVTLNDIIQGTQLKISYGAHYIRSNL